MNQADILIIVSAIGIAALLSQIVALILLVTFVSKNLVSKNSLIKTLTSVISSNALVLAFFVALFAASGSLFLSEIAHYPPCKLCWYQRIFLYPQVFLLGLAAFKKDFAMKTYILVLSGIGSLIAIYHYILQIAPFPLPCSDEVASCAAKQINFAGYLTIPLMSLTAFALIILLMMFVPEKKK